MGHPRFREILDELAQLHNNKNADYAGDDPLSNLLACEIAGISAEQGVYTRMTDKMSRLATFLKRHKLQVESEKITDTLNDLANYAILLRILLERERR